MTKYTKTITLESVDGYKPVKFTVVEADTKEDADKELKKWIDDYPELLKNENNKTILSWVLNGK